MIGWLIFYALLIVVCVWLNNASSKIGMPVLLAFILLGIIFGNCFGQDYVFNNYKVAEKTCTIALIFIMFYGGFGTSWKSAKKIAGEASVLATAGVIVTAGLTAVLCHFLLKWDWLESILLGSVISSTDAASVFSILRSRKLGLKNNSAPLLEMESGSNDPMSYMLTIIALSLFQGEASGWGMAFLLFKQLVFGAAIGFGIAYLAITAMHKVSFATSGFDSLFILAIAMLSYAIPNLVDGNGYLSAYIVGMMLGNTQFNGKKQLVHFFDGVTGLMQVVIFFLLGLLARPKLLLDSFLPALAVFAILLFAARPTAVFSVLAPLKKYSFRQMLLISFVGLRGAASIVFAIMALTQTDGATLEHDGFSVVFTVVLISIALQGSLIPFVAKRLGQIDTNEDVMKTFNDFADETDVQFSQVLVTPDSSWNGKMVKELNIPKNLLMCLNVKRNGEHIVPYGEMFIESGDTIILCALAAAKDAYVHIVVHPLSKGSKWVGHKVMEYPRDIREQLVMIKRGDESIVPNGGTVLQEGDILYINQG